MPSTTSKRFNRIVGWFGDADTNGPERVLKAQGFIVDEKWLIHPPTRSHSGTFEQNELVMFLIQEWDYGYADFDER